MSEVQATSPDEFHLYDTTLRDGAQREGASRTPLPTNSPSPDSSTTSVSVSSKADGPAPCRRTPSSSPVPTTS